MTPDRAIDALSPLISRVRRADHWVKPHGGSPVHRLGKLTDAVLLTHFQNVLPAGACPMEQGSSVTTLALLDLDSHKGEVPWEEMVATAKRLIQSARILYGIELIPFRSSGGLGIHLYALWPTDRPQDARSVRAALAEVLASCGLKNGTRGVREGQAEIFPKQDSIPSDGWGNMFVLPGAGKSAPLEPLTLSEASLIDVDWWVDSDPVPVVAPPPMPVSTVGEMPELERVRSALAAIDPNELDYGASGGVGWLEILFAVHAATEGSEEGLSLVLEWSSGWSGFDPTASVAETVKQWRAAKIRPGGIGPGTLFRAARERGWRDPEALALTDSTGFGVSTADPPPDGPSTVLDTAPGLGNMVIAARDPGALGCRLAYDAFTAGLLIDVGRGRRPATDNDLTRVRCRLESLGFRKPGVEDTRAIMHLVAEECEVDTAIEWVEGLPAWDGTPRVASFLHRYLGAEDTAYTRAVSRYLWTALVGRVLAPGCKADMVPVLVGEQGIGKSTAVMAIVPDAREQYAEINLGNMHDADQSRLLRGKLVGEIAELRGLSSRDAESIKAWVTRQHEEWTPKFKEFNTTFPRRCIFIGTTNERNFLTDTTGNRRWLPVEVKRGDIPAIERDRDQLWAEAVAVYRADGITWQDAEVLGRSEHKRYLNIDEWAEAIREHLIETDRAMSIREIAAEVLRIDLRALDERVKKRIVAALKTIEGAHRWHGRDGTGRSTGVWKIKPPTYRVEDLV